MVGMGNSSQGIVLRLSCHIALEGSRLFSITGDTQSRMIELLSSHLFDLSFVAKVGYQDVIKPELGYEPPLYARSIYPLLLGLHKIFVDSPSIEKALVHAQKRLRSIKKGETLGNQLLSEVYTFQIAVEGLRIALNYVGCLPISKLGSPDLTKTDFPNSLVKFTLC